MANTIITLINSPGNSSEAVYAGRPDELLMYLSYINCSGHETQLTHCPYLNAAAAIDGIVWSGDGKVYCPWSVVVDGLWQYQVAKVYCTSKCT